MRWTPCGSWNAPLTRVAPIPAMCGTMWPAPCMTRGRRTMTGKPDVVRCPCCDGPVTECPTCDGDGFISALSDPADDYEPPPWPSCDGVPIRAIDMLPDLLRAWNAVTITGVDHAVLAALAKLGYPDRE